MSVTQAWKQILILVLIISIPFVSAESQATESILVRTVKADLVVQAEVVGLSEVAPYCIPFKCQVVAFHILQVLKGNYEPQYLNVQFLISDSGRYIENKKNYTGLNRNLFSKGKQWILVLDSKYSLKADFGSDEMKPYKDFTCLLGSAEAITPGNNDEVEAFKALIKATTPANR